MKYTGNPEEKLKQLQYTCLAIKWLEQVQMRLSENNAPCDGLIIEFKYAMVLLKEFDDECN